MPSIERVADLDDPRLDDFRATREGDALRRRGVFVGEGMLVLQRMLAPDARFALKAVLLDARREGEARALLDASPVAGDLPVFVTARDALERVIGFPFHQGVLALGERREERDALCALDEFLRDAPSTALILDGLVDHDNIGAAFRNAAAFGASAVLLSPTCADPLYRKSIRTSLGHALRVPTARFARGDWPRGMDALRDRGVLTVALTPGDDARDIDEFAATLAPGRRLALLVGTEGPGLSERAMRLADARVRIPMAPGADSINVSAALAVALHALRPRPGTLAP